MTSVTEGSRLLTPTLLGRDGVLRAFPLLGSDRGDLSLEDWLDECRPVEASDRSLVETPPPGAGMVGLAGPAGCLFAVFGYAAVESPEGRSILEVRGPSCARMAGERLIKEELDRAIDELTTYLGCTRALLRGW